jgi:phosphoribosylformylglycinamidine synthase
LGKGDVRRWKGAPEGSSLALVGETKPEYGGSILDAVVACGGDPPAVADPAVLTAVRDLVAGGRCEAATDLSKGGLLGALAALSPSAGVDLGPDALCELFSETSGRFLLAVRDEGVLQSLSLSHEEMGHALSSLTRVMRS